MKNKVRPNFRLEKVYADGSREAPEIYKVGDLNGDWRMGRRGFLGTTAIGAAAAWSLIGCSGSEESPEKAVNGKCQTDVLAHRSGVTSIAYSPDGKFLVSGGHDGKVKLWEMPSGHLVRTWGEHTHSVKSVCFEPSGNKVASGSSDETIKIWDASSGKLLEDLKAGPFVAAIAFSPDGRLLVSANDDRLKAWKLPSRNPIDIRTGWITALTFSPDGKLLATGHNSGPIRLWNAESFKIMEELGSGWLTYLYGKRDFRSLAISPDGKYLAASEKHEIHIWELSTQKLAHTLKGHEKTPKGDENIFQTVAFSPSADWIAAGSCSLVGGTREYVEISLELWQIATGKQVMILLRTSEERHVPLGPGGASACFSPSGTHLTVGFADGTIRVWELPSGKHFTCLSDTGADTPTGTDFSTGTDSPSAPSAPPGPHYGGGIICICESICTCVPIK